MRGAGGGVERLEERACRPVVVDLAAADGREDITLRVGDVVGRCRFDTEGEESADERSRTDTPLEKASAPAKNLGIRSDCRLSRGRERRDTIPCPEGQVKASGLESHRSDLGQESQRQDAHADS